MGAGCCGWSVPMVVIAMMAQYFMNAVINKNISVVYNKMCHAIGMLTLFWGGDMLIMHDPKETFSFMKIFNLIILSLNIVAVVYMFVISKDAPKTDDKQKEEKEGVELAETKKADMEDAPPVLEAETPRTLEVKAALMEEDDDDASLMEEGSASQATDRQ